MRLCSEVYVRHLPYPGVPAERAREGGTDAYLLADVGRAYLVVPFFFSSRRRHTRYWRDWSSDVCSSDLDGVGRGVNDGSVSAQYFLAAARAESQRNVASATLFPPSTTSICPVMYDAAGEHRNEIAAATSSGVPGRPIGVAKPCFSSTSVEAPVWMMPGATALTVMPSATSSIASARVRPTTPDFAAAYP